MVTPRAALNYLVLAALALGTGWLAHRLTPSEEPGPEPVRGKIDYYSKHIRRTTLDERGQPKQLLVADELVHYEGNDRTELIHPVLTLYKEGGPPWVFHAETATLPDQGEWIYMNGPVVILRNADQSDPNARTLRIDTANVRVQPDREYAETDEFVRVVSPPDELTGTGAKVHYGEEFKATILSHVQRKHTVR
jgi:lipopolysaccharide export system protein LptC